MSYLYIYSIISSASLKSLLKVYTTDHDKLKRDLKLTCRGKARRNFSRELTSNHSKNPERHDLL